MNQLLHVSASPHIKDRVTTSSIMLDVIIALIPATLFGIIQFKINALLIIVTTITTCVLAEYLYERFMHICCFACSSEPGQNPCPPGRWTAAVPAPRSPTAGARHAPAPIPSAPRWRLPHELCVLQLLPVPPPALHDRCKYRTPPRHRPLYAPFSTHNTRCSRPDNNSSKFSAISTLQTYIFCLFC